MVVGKNITHRENKDVGRIYFEEAEVGRLIVEVRFVKREEN